MLQKQAREKEMAEKKVKQKEMARQGRSGILWNDEPTSPKGLMGMRRRPGEV